MENIKDFLGKECKLILNNGFTLRGEITDCNMFGIYFKTKQRIAYHGFSNIKELLLLDDVHNSKKWGDNNNGG